MADYDGTWPSARLHIYATNLSPVDKQRLGYVFTCLRRYGCPAPTRMLHPQGAPNEGIGFVWEQSGRRMYFGQRRGTPTILRMYSPRTRTLRGVQLYPGLPLHDTIDLLMQALTHPDLVTTI